MRGAEGLTANAKGPETLDIHQAAASGDVERVRSALAADPAAHTLRNASGRLPLHLAALAGRLPQPGHLQTVQVLLDAGADPNALSPDDYLGDGSALLFAAYSSSRNTEIVRLLLQRGADPSQANSRGLTPLAIASREGAREICDILLEHGAEMDIHCLAALGLVREMRKLLRQDPDLVKARDPHQGAPPLYFAAWRDRKDAAALLLEFEADIAGHDASGNPPVHAAAAAGAKRTLEYLIEQGADVNARNHEKQTPLHWAVDEFYVEGSETVKLLLLHGADANAQDLNKETPITKAVALNKTHLVEVLRGRGRR